MAVRYLGPADTFGYGGKWYRKGDSVPITKEEIEHLAANGHRFEGNDPAMQTGVVLGYAPQPPVPMPFDDRGQQLDLPESKHTAQVPEGAPVPVVKTDKA